MTINGLDCSNWQRQVDWPSVAGAGFSFTFIKASEGVTFPDPWFAPNWNGAPAAGLARAAYHFARPSVSSALDESEFFRSIVQNHLTTGDVLALDIEDTNVPNGVNLAAWVLEWLQRVEGWCGFKPMIYSGAWYMQPHGLFTAELADYGLWYASYQKTAPPAPAPWPFVAVWQYSGSGNVPGIAGPVDLDVFNGTVDQFRLYGKPQQADPCVELERELAAANMQNAALTKVLAAIKDEMQILHDTIDRAIGG